MGRKLGIYRNPHSFMRLKEADPFYEKSKKTLSNKCMVFPNKS